MSSAMRAKVLIAVFLFFCANFTSAAPWINNVDRRDASIVSLSAATLSSSSEGSAPTLTPSSGHDGISSTTTGLSATQASSPTSTTASSDIPSGTVSIIPSIIPPPTLLLNYTGYNFTLTPNELPIQPEVTPGFAVAGVIILITGVGYALVGMKNKWLQIYLSAAYLGGLAVTVLVLYVMNTPTSNAVQAAYIVAAIVTGAILGGASIIFTEMTEGLGCLLGGFCLSMWLLVLQPGGLLTSTGAKSVFIAAFSIVGYSLSFSHYTRPYALICLVSFGGATATVLGIDCFSRAGLKEFWAYLWDLNDNLFPLGATSYPLTRGIKVEIAAIVVIFLAGVMSQMKLWRIIKQRRDARAAVRSEEQRTKEQEEENIGRQLEQANAHDRNEWEAVYGDKEANKMSMSQDSGVDGMDTPKKGPTSTAVSVPSSDGDEIEMLQMSESTAAAVLVSPKEPEEASDKSGNEQDGLAGVKVERKPSVKEATQTAETTISEPPAVLDAVSFPVNVAECENDDSRSSIAAEVADEDLETYKRRSKHLSAGSMILRRLSKRSNRNSKHLSTGSTRLQGTSTENLMSGPKDEEDRASSLAATVDGLSDDEDDLRMMPHSQSIPDSHEESPADEQTRTVEQHTTTVHSSSDVLLASIAMAGSELPKTAKELSQSSEEPKITADRTSSTEVKEEESRQEGARAKDITVQSETANVTNDRLPAQLSRVAMSHRTNEWAKHLSNAEIPETEALQVTDDTEDGQDTMVPVEIAAPVNIEELQQVPETRLGPTTLRHVSKSAEPRSNTAFSKQTVLGASRMNSSSSLQSSDQRPSRSVSRQSMVSSTQGQRIRTGSPAIIPKPIVESPIEDEAMLNTSTQLKESSLPPALALHSSSAATNTLISKRSSILQNKSLYGTSNGLQGFSGSGYFPPVQSVPASRGSSDRGSMQNYGVETQARVFISIKEDDDMPLSERRKLIRQSSLGQVSSSSPVTTPIRSHAHQPKRVSSVPTPQAREQQLASFRASVQQEFQSQVVPQHTLERQRSALWEGRQQEAQRKAMEDKMKVQRHSVFDERMRRGDMLDAHREALRKMQATANKNAQ